MFSLLRQYIPIYVLYDLHLFSIGGVDGFNVTLTRFDFHSKLVLLIYDKYQISTCLRKQREKSFKISHLCFFPRIVPGHFSALQFGFWFCFDSCFAGFKSPLIKWNKEEKVRRESDADKITNKMNLKIIPKKEEDTKKEEEKVN